MSITPSLRQNRLLTVSTGVAILLCAAWSCAQSPTDPSKIDWRDGDRVAFLGGTLGGALSSAFGLDAVFVGCAVLALGWWLFMWRLPSPPPLSSEVVALGDTHPDTLELLMQRLADVVGVEDVMVVPEERLMYLKVNRKALDRGALDKLIPTDKP